jgi:hypothetical protein
MERISIVGQKSPSQAAKARLHMLIRSLSLGLRCGGYKDDHPTGIKLGCSTVLSHQSDGLIVSIWWRNKVLNTL